MGFISWIFLGGISGWLANKFLGGKKLGTFGNICVGIVGSMIGGFVFNSIGKSGVTGFNLYSIFVAAVGAWILLFVITKLTDKD